MNTLSLSWVLFLVWGQVPCRPAGLKFLTSCHHLPTAGIKGMQHQRCFPLYFNKHSAVSIWYVFKSYHISDLSNTYPGFSSVPFLGIFYFVFDNSHSWFPWEKLALLFAGLCSCLSVGTAHLIYLVVSP